MLKLLQDLLTHPLWGPLVFLMLAVFVVCLVGSLIGFAEGVWRRDRARILAFWRTPVPPIFASVYLLSPLPFGWPVFFIVWLLWVLEHWLADAAKVEAIIAAIVRGGGDLAAAGVRLAREAWADRQALAAARAPAMAVRMGIAGDVPAASPSKRRGWTFAQIFIGLIGVIMVIFALMFLVQQLTGAGVRAERANNRAAVSEGQRQSAERRIEFQERQVERIVYVERRLPEIERRVDHARSAIDAASDFDGMLAAHDAAVRELRASADAAHDRAMSDYRASLSARGEPAPGADLARRPADGVAAASAA